MTHKEVRTERTIASLLRSKNRCLERFLALTEDFLAQPALDPLPSFEERRAKLVHALRLFDAKISEAIAVFPRPASKAWLDEARALLKQGDASIARILELDREVLARVEGAQAALMREIHQSRKSRELVGKFKSEWMPQSGEGLDSKL